MEKQMSFVRFEFGTEVEWVTFVEAVQAAIFRWMGHRSNEEAVIPVLRVSFAQHRVIGTTDKEFFEIKIQADLESLSPSDTENVLRDLAGYLIDDLELIVRPVFGFG